MNRRLFIFSSYIILIIEVIVLFSCRTTKKIKKLNKNKYSIEELIDKNNSLTNPVTTLSRRGIIEYSSKGNKSSFGCVMRVITDSVIWISISPGLGIEVARMQFTADSIKFLNRITKKYFIGNYSFVDSVFSVSVDFNMLQSVLYNRLPKNILLADKQSLSFTKNDSSIILSNTLDKTVHQMNCHSSYNQEYIIDETNATITKAKFVDSSAKHTLKIEYLGFKTLQNSNIVLPLELVIKLLGSGQNMDLSIHFSKSQVNNSIRVPFNISSKYTLLFK